MDDVRMQEAAAWWAKFQECEPATEDVTEWLAWMERDDANAQAFESMNELALRIRHTRTAAPDQMLRLQAPLKSRTGVSIWKLALAACLLAAVGAAAVIGLRLTPPSTTNGAGVGVSTYTTQTAVQREVLLPDGSRVVLGGASAIETNFSPERRQLRLITGEAYFQVKHEASSRPFIVDVGLATVRAVGTAFNIRKSDNRVALTVTEGRVKVDRAEGLLTRLAVSTGLEDAKTVEVGTAQEVLIEPSRAPLAVAAADAQRATSWRRGHLEFVDEPLDAVIENVGRYATRPLLGDDPRLHSITYTGSFDPEHFDSWLDALERVFPVQIDRNGDTTKIRARPASP